MSEPLLKTGDISRVEILRLQKQVAELEGQIINRRNKYFQDAQTELTRVQEELRSQQQSLTDRSVNFNRTEIRTPAAGVVRNIRITTRGARVRPGDIMLDLLPTDGELVLEAKLKPGDIGHVAVGQPATVKLDAWDYSIYGMLDGDVIYISPDALNEDTRAGEQIYYRIRIRIRPDSRLRDRTGKTIEVQSGMTGQIDIRTGGQTVLTYLTKPVTKTLHQSFLER
jgi:HlyD family type I secretion membrane fusion protein